MTSRARAQRVDEVEGLRREHEMVRQHARCFGSVDAFGPARCKMRNEPSDCAVDTDECTITLPRDEIDVRVDLAQARAWRRGFACTEAREARKSRRRQRRYERPGDPVPGWNEHRLETAAEPSLQSYATGAELTDALGDAALAAELGGALAGWLMIRVRIAVLYDRCVRAGANCINQCRIGLCGNRRTR